MKKIIGLLGALVAPALTMPKNIHDLDRTVETIYGYWKRAYKFLGDNAVQAATAAAEIADLVSRHDALPDLEDAPQSPPVAPAGVRVEA